MHYLIEQTTKSWQIIKSRLSNEMIYLAREYAKIKYTNTDDFVFHHDK